MKTYHILFLLVLFFTACRQNETTGKQAGLVIPELKQRPAVIGPLDEMGQMNDLYVKLAAQIRRQPDKPEHRLALAELFMQEARISGDHGYYYPAALRLIEEALAQQPVQEVRYRALLDQSSVLMSLHQFAEARTVAQQAVAINAYDASIYGILVDANVEMGQYTEAVDMADKMISIRPDLRSYSRVSYLREIYGDVPGAIEAMQYAVSAGYPGFEQTEWARLNLGNLYRHYGRLDSAEYQYRMALEMRPNYPFAVAALAGIATAKGDRAEAEQLLKKACALIPEIGFYVDLARLYREEGRQAETRQLTREILAMLADDERAGHQMALEYAAVYLDLLDNPGKALAYAQKEYEQRPANIDVNRRLALIYYRIGDWFKAQEHLDKALATQSKNPELLCLAGLLKVKRGANAEGTQLIKQALAANPYLDGALGEDAKKSIQTL